MISEKWLHLSVMVCTLGGFDIHVLHLLRINTAEMFFLKCSFIGGWQSGSKALKKSTYYSVWWITFCSCVHACKAHYVWCRSQGHIVSPCSSYLWQWQGEPEEVCPLIKHLYPGKQRVQLQPQHRLWHQGLFWSYPPRFRGFSKGGPLFSTPLLPSHSRPLHQEVWC